MSQLLIAAFATLAAAQSAAAPVPPSGDELTLDGFDVLTLDGIETLTL